MEDKKLLQDLKRHPPKLRRGKSDLYRWLEENLQRLTAQGYGTPDGPEWQELTDRLNRIGKVNKNGQPLGVWGLISIFKRVKRDVEARQRDARTGVSTPRPQARMPKGWTPPVLQTPTISAATESRSHQVRPAQNEPAPFAPTASSTGNVDPSRMTPEERKADLRRVIDKRSGR